MGARSDAHPHFQDWLKKMGVDKVSYNERDIQSVTSDVCGLYACYFALHGLPELNPKPWSWLTRNVSNNDAVVRTLVKVTQ